MNDVEVRDIDEDGVRKVYMEGLRDKRTIVKEMEADNKGEGGVLNLWEMRLCFGCRQSRHDFGQANLAMTVPVAAFRSPTPNRLKRRMKLFVSHVVTHDHASPSPVITSPEKR